VPGPSNSDHTQIPEAITIKRRPLNPIRVVWSRSTSATSRVPILSALGEVAESRRSACCRLPSTSGELLSPQSAQSALETHRLNHPLRRPSTDQHQQAPTRRSENVCREGGEVRLDQTCPRWMVQSVVSSADCAD